MSDPSTAVDPTASSRTSHVEATVISTIADPAPLGLAAFAMTTFLLSLGNSNLVKGVGSGAVLALALVYGGVGQLLAGMWEFKNKNTFGALAFTSYGAFWIAYFYFAKYLAGGLGPTVYQAAGYFLLCWTIFTAYMFIASLKTNVAVAAVFLALTVTFLLLTIGALDQKSGITHAGGYAGIVTAAFAWYASFAGVTNATWKRIVLPVWPLS